MGQLILKAEYPKTNLLRWVLATNDISKIFEKSD